MNSFKHYKTITMGNPIGTNSHLQVEAIKSLDRITKLPFKIGCLSSDTTEQVVKSSARQELVKDGGLPEIKYTYEIRPNFCSISMRVGEEVIPLVAHNGKLTRDAIRKTITQFRVLYGKDNNTFNIDKE